MSVQKKSTNFKRKKSPTIKHINKKDSLINEITCIIIIAIGILFIISIYTDDIAGIIGIILSNVLKGFFGVGAYILPLVLICIGSFKFIKGETLPMLLKYILITLIFLCTISLAHIISVDMDRQYVNIFEYIVQNYNDGNLYNGGIVGAIFGNLFLAIVGRIGSYIILTTSFLILLILLTGKSFNGILKEIPHFVESINFETDYYADVDELNAGNKKPQKNIKHNKSTPVSKIYKELNKNNKAKTFVIGGNSIKENNKRILLFNEELKGFTHKLSAEYDAEDVIHEDKSTKEQEIKLKGFEMEHDYSHIDIDEDRELRDEVFIKTYNDENETIHNENHISNKQAVYNNSDVSEDLEGEDRYAHNYIDRDESKGIGEDPRETKIKSQDYRHMIESRVKELVTKTGSSDNRSHMQVSSVNRIPEQTKFEAGLANSFKDALKTEVKYVFPPIDLLKKNPILSGAGSKAQILENSKKLEQTLKSFGVQAKVIEVSKGPTVTRYELSPGQGVKVSKISNLADDLALNLAASGIRIEAPIPGKAAVGIEVPNKEITPVFLREVLEDSIFKSFPSNLAFGLGKDIAGNTVVTDIAKMPHMLVAGATGSGKSVCINTLVTSIIYKSSPVDVKLLMIDPKVVELSVYNGIPHLLIPVVTDPKKAAGALNWAVTEMIERYNYFAENSVRDLKGYNSVLEERGEVKLPQIVIIIDELADLMMAAPSEVEDAICRLAQMARAAGIHLIIATQRPSVDVITGLIKANIPSRLAFSVSSGTDSRTILDMIGAEKLLGKGDMLFFPVGMSKPQRIQGAFISDKEVEIIVNFVKNEQEHVYDQEMIDKITAAKSIGTIGDEADKVFVTAVDFILQKEKASASMLQRQFRIGYNRAARLIEDLEARGIVGPEEGSKPRKVLMTTEQWEEYKAGLNE